MSRLLNCYYKALEFLDAEGTELQKKDIEAIAKTLVKAKADSLSKAEFASKISDELSARLKEVNIRKKAATLITKAQREDMLAAVKDKAPGTTFMGRAKSAYVGGAVRAITGGNRNIYHVKDANRSSLKRVWKTGIDRLDFKDVIHQKLDEGDFGRLFYQELHAIQKGDLSTPSKSKEAFAIAKNFNALLNSAFDRMKAYNPWLNRIDDYGAKQVWNQDKVRALGEQVWLQHMHQYAKNKSFPELATDADLNERFLNIYQRIVDGDYGSVVDEGKWETNYSGPNIHRQMARERSIIANDWESQFELAKIYGHNTVADMVESTINNAGRNIALIDKFGPKPQVFHEGFKKRVAQIAGRDLTKAEIDSLDRSFFMATESDLNIASSMTGKITQGLLNVQIAAKLGFSALRTIPDMATSALTLRSVSGKNVFQAIGGSILPKFLSLLPNPKERTRLLELLDLDYSAQRHFHSADMGTSDGQIGFLSQAVELHGKLNFLGAFTRNAKASNGVVLTSEMFQQSKKDFSNLKDFFQNNLKRYNITEHRWNALRLASYDGVDPRNGKKLKMLTTEGIERLPDEVFENMIRKQHLAKTGTKRATIPIDEINRERFKLSTDYSVMVQDFADIGSSTANLRQKEMLTQGIRIDDAFGAFLRIATQFKSAAIATFEGYQRGLWSNKVAGADIAGVATAAVSSMILWYFQKSVQDMILGKTPEEPSPKLAVQALLSSGALGPIGDMYSSQLMLDNRMTRKDSLYRTLLGPTIPDALEFGFTIPSLLGDSLTDEDRKVPLNDIWKVVRRNIPFQNLWVTKGVMDYYIFNEISESLNSGFLRQLEDRLEEGGQSQFLFNPESDNILGSDL